MRRTTPNRESRDPQSQNRLDLVEPGEPDFEPETIARYRVALVREEATPYESPESCGDPANNMNEITTQGPGGPLVFRGTTDEEAVVTVAEEPATMGANTDSGYPFSKAAPVPSGTSQVAVSAHDFANPPNTATNVYEVTQTGTSRSFSFDANGNLTSDGTRTFEWDAENHFTAINIGTHRSEFAYDGAGRRVEFLEKESGNLVAERHFIWRESKPVEERDGTGVVVQRHLAFGFERGGTS